MTRPTPRFPWRVPARPLPLAAFGIVFVVLALGIVVIGRVPHANAAFQPPWDKVAHFCAFAALALAGLVATAGRAPLAVCWTGVVVAALDELGQRGVPGRSADVGDFATDVTATLLTVLVCVVLTRTRPRLSSASRGADAPPRVHHPDRAP